MRVELELSNFSEQAKASATAEAFVHGVMQLADPVRGGRVDVGDPHLAPSENKTFWTEFLRGLRERGWTGCSWSSPITTVG